MKLLGAESLSFSFNSLFVRNSRQTLNFLSILSSTVNLWNERLLLLFSLNFCSPFPPSLKLLFFQARTAHLLHGRDPDVGQVLPEDRHERQGKEGSLIFSDRKK